MTLLNPDLVDWDDLDPKDHDEPSLDFLQRSGWEAFQNIRALLESWFAAYPDEHKHEFKRSFGSDPYDLTSPLFELALHAIFTKLGAQVEVHPLISDSVSRRPDFRVTFPDGPRFYVEAVLAKGQSDGDRKREQTLRKLYRVVDQKFDSKDYYWSVTVLAHGATEPKFSQVVGALTTYMRGLTFDEVASATERHGLQADTKLEVESNGWRFEFQPLPIRRELLGKPIRRPLGLFQMESAEFCDDEGDIRQAVTRKIDHHSKLDLPLVVAVNAMRWSVQGEDFINALYGSDVVNITTYTDGTHSCKPKRALNGIWMGSRGTKNAHVPAVIGCVSLQPWTVAVTDVNLYPNPYAEGTVGNMWSLPKYGAVDGTLQKLGGSTLRDFFRLSADWPGRKGAD